MTNKPEVSSDYPLGSVIERPDGFYWQGREDGKEYGPFATLLDALQDMEGEGGDVEPGETREEAESEIAVADWIDPETGELAEESVPRIEDH
jgi:hypothetical protein